ncbi:MAG TPA: RND family transporter, partial [Proteobacteria bacterium]|nr:RND family transporter [Pseudomonadota bacterium]
FRIARFILKYRFTTLIVVAGLTVLLLSQAVHLRFAQNLKNDLPKDDPEIVFFEKFHNQFSNSELSVITVSGRRVFHYDVLSYIDRLTRLISGVHDIKDVVSITNIYEIVGTPEGFEVKPFIEKVPKDTKKLKELERRALRNPEWVRDLISPDGTAAAINISIELLRDDATFRFRVVKDIEHILKKNPPPEGVTVHFTGISTFGVEALKTMKRDMKEFAWLTPIIVIITLFFAFRNLRGVVVPHAILFTSVVWTLGVFMWRGNAISMITTMLPTLIGVICLSDVIHIITRYYEESYKSRDKKQVLENTLAHMIEPCFLTSSTTAVGFGSLATSRLLQVKLFGYYSALGIMISYILAITLTPVILSFLPLPRAGLRKRYQTGALTKVLNSVEDFVERDRFVVFTITAICVIAAIVGITRIRVETRISEFLPQNSPSVVGLRFLCEKFAGVSSLEMTLSGPPEIFKEPEALKAVSKLQDFLESLPEVDKVYSFANFVKKFNQAMHEGKEEFYTIPDSRDLIAQYLLLFSMTGREDLLGAFINYDYSWTRISARIKSMGSKGHLELLRKVEAWADKNLPKTVNGKKLEFRTTGIVKLYAVITTALINSQLKSLGLALVFITILMIIHMRSLKIGLVSMIPNVIPIIITLGFMGWLDIALNVATVMISCIALGIAVDDTIHYLARYKHEVRSDEDRQIIPAMRRTMLNTGRAMVYTTVVIAGGFFILSFSSFLTNRAFGILTGVTMITALLADLLLLPVLVRVFKLR